MDARGRPMVVLHKLLPNGGGTGGKGGDDDDAHMDRLVVDLSPLRLPGDFRILEDELRGRIYAEFGVDVRINDIELGDSLTPDDASVIDGDVVNDDENDDSDDNDDDDDDWGKRPIYQLSPHYISWGVSRQEGKKVGKYIGKLFDNVEEKGHDTKTKPKGVKPGKGRRHGGYGI